MRSVDGRVTMQAFLGRVDVSCSRFSLATTSLNFHSTSFFTFKLVFLCEVILLCQTVVCFVVFDMPLPRGRLDSGGVWCGCGGGDTAEGVLNYVGIELIGCPMQAMEANGSCKTIPIAAVEKAVSGLDAAKDILDIFNALVRCSAVHDAVH